MTNEEIKKLADGYYAGNADWLNKEQEQDTKVGWRQGFAYALRQFAVSSSLPLFKCKCGYETSNSVAWCIHADCCNGNDR